MIVLAWTPYWLVDHGLMSEWFWATATCALALFWCRPVARSPE